MTDEILTIREVAAATNFPEEIQNLRIEDRGVTVIETESFGKLELASFGCHKAASANFDGLHQMHLVANGRTVTTRKIDGLIGIGRFGPNDDSVYHGCVTGEFLDERVNQERTQFNFDESIVEEIVRNCAEFSRDHAIKDEVAEFDRQRLGTMREFVDEYPSFAFEGAEELLSRTPMNAIKAEEFARALIPIRIRRDQERNKTIKKIVATQDFQLESTLHQFICPMKLRGDDPTKVEESDHDLWIIDERLTFTKYFASDVPFTQIVANEDSRRRPDLFIFDHLHGLGADGEDPLKRVMLVEFKQPGRRDYDERYSPLNQISEYITRLKNGEIEDFQQGRVRIAEDCVFYCYVVADIVGRLDVHTSAWRTTANGRGRIHELQGKFRGIIEIIEWADLIADARLRNHAFLHAAGLRYDQHP
jgi:hypothetical protein